MAKLISYEVCGRPAYMKYRRGFTPTIRAVCELEDGFRFNAIIFTTESFLRRRAAVIEAYVRETVEKTKQLPQSVRDATRRRF